MKKYIVYLSLFLAFLTPMVTINYSNTESALAMPEDTISNNEAECDFNIFLNWIICNFFDGANKLVFDFLAEDQFLRRFLTINFETGAGLGNEQDEENTDLTTDMKKMWQNVRDITNALFVILFVIAILGHVTGAVEAYTAKKIIPRIVIAAILTQLSWFISTELSAIFDDFGIGIGDLIESSLGTQDIELTDILSAGNDNGVDEGVGAAAAIGIFYIIASGMGGIAFSTALMILLPFAIAVVIAVVVSIATLMARKVILIMMVILSPIAMVMWALPATDKWARKWFSWFTVMLMMYPMIIAAIATGKALSVVLGGSGDGGGQERDWIFQLGALMVYIVPYIMLPFIVKLAMSTFSNVTGAIDGVGKSASGKVKSFAKGQREGLRGMRQKKGAGNYQDAKNAAPALIAGGATFGERARNRFKQASGRAYSGHALPTKYNNQALDEFADGKEQEARAHEGLATSRRRLEHGRDFVDGNMDSTSVYTKQSKIIISEIEAEAERVGGASNLDADERVAYDLLQEHLAVDGSDRETAELMAAEELLGKNKSSIDKIREAAKADPDKMYGALDGDSAQVEDIKRILGASTGDEVELLGGQTMTVTPALQYSAFKDSMDNDSSSQAAAASRRSFIRTREDSLTNSVGDQKAVQGVLKSFAGPLMGSAADSLLGYGGAIGQGGQKLLSYKEGDLKGLLQNTSTQEFRNTISAVFEGGRKPAARNRHVNANGVAIRKAVAKRHSSGEIGDITLNAVNSAIRPDGSLASEKAFNDLLDADHTVKDPATGALVDKKLIDIISMGH